MLVSDVLQNDSDLLCVYIWTSPHELMSKNPSVNAREIRDVASISRSGRSPGGRHSNPLQYACLDIPWTEEPGKLQSRLQRVGHD